MTDFSVDVFWSYRSPYCYLTLDRFVDWRRAFEVTINIRPVYPMAVRDPSFFANINRKYRPYHTNDYHRVGEMLGMPVRKPVPDPIVMDNEQYEISDEQPHIARLTRTGVAAQKRGKCFEFTDAMMRTIWDGATDDWNTDAHYAAAIEKASADFNAAHKREFTFVLPNAVELVNYHVVALSSIDKQPLARKSATGRTVAEACVGRRTVDFDEAGIHEADIYDLGRLEPGMAFTGPAIIEDATTTIVVTPGRPVSMDAYGNIHIVME